MIRIVRGFLHESVLNLYEHFWDLGVFQDHLMAESGQYDYQPKDAKASTSPETYCMKHNIMDDALLLMCRSKVEKELEENLIPSYSWSRQYTRGTELKKHRDRKACEISVSIPMYAECEESPIYFSETEDGINSERVDLNVGDAVIFTGAHEDDGLWHWREPLDGDRLITLFLHYVRDVKNAQFDYPRPRIARS